MEIAGGKLTLAEGLLPLLPHAPVGRGGRLRSTVILVRGHGGERLLSFLPVGSAETGALCCACGLRVRPQLFELFLQCGHLEFQLEDPADAGEGHALAGHV